MKKWTKEETNILKENMDSCLVELKNLLPERNDEQIIEKIKLLYRQAPSIRWSDEEDDIIISNRTSNLFGLMKLLPNRTYSAILSRRTQLVATRGLYHLRTKHMWSPEDLKRLEELKDEGYTNYEIADMLKRPLNSIMGRLYTSGKNRSKFTKKDWSVEDTEMLSNRINNGDAIENIAEDLGIARNKVYQKGIHLGFSGFDMVTLSKIKKQDGKQLRQSIKELRKEISQKNTLIKSLQKSLQK